MSRVLARLRRPGATRLALVFVGVPALAFGVPAMVGRTWLVGDNLIQNYPLRSLVGTDLAHGHLPLWDPYLWSGAPLLAGFNAGAAYPLTWLFAVLPHTLAWVSNQVAVEVVAASGMAALLRALGRSWGASGLGAAAFAYGGFVAMQGEHIDVVQAAGWLVWAFVALERLYHRPVGRRAAPWIALLGLSLGLMVLTGSAEPLLDGAVVLIVFTVWRVVQSPGRRWVLAGQAVAGAALGVLVGAAQLLPGGTLQGQSQRAVHDLWYFGSGSMNKSLTLLGLDPMILGIGHSWPLGFVGTYNLPELSSYIGILPVMGIVGLLARRHRRHPEARQWWVWYAIGALGLVLAWGSFTPLVHLEFLVPLYNRQRLLARNLLEVDLAMAVLFATWVDHMLLAPRRRPEERPEARPGPRRRAWSSDVVLPLLPVVAVVGLQVVILAGGPWFPHFLHVPGPVSYGILWRLGVFLTIPSAIALAAGWLVVRGPRQDRWKVPLAAAVLGVDLLVFNVANQVYPLAETAAAPNASADALAAAVAAAGTGPGGLPHRVALFDPDRLHPNETEAIGQPDLTILRDISSVQGYGAVVEGSYDAATGTHLQGNVTPAALADGRLSGLDLGVLLTVPEYFVHEEIAPAAVPASVIEGATSLPPVPADRAGPLSPTTAPPTSPGDYTEAPAPASSVALTAGQTRTWYFGTTLAVGAVNLPVAVSGPGAAQLRVGLLSPDGARVRWGAPVTVTSATGPSVLVSQPNAPDAGGMAVELLASSGSPPAVSIGAAVLSTAGQGTYRVDGVLRDVVSAPQWRFAGRIGVFDVFRNTAASGRAFLEPAATGRATVRSATTWGTEQVEVRTPKPVTLVRDEAFASGWQASITGADGRGPATSVVVSPHGLVQSVRVPAGDHLVTFRYRPHRVVEGLLASAAGVVLALGLVIVGRRGLGRRRRDAAAPGASARSARAPDDAAPDRVPIGVAGRAAGPPPRGPSRGG